MRSLSLFVISLVMLAACSSVDPATPEPAATPETQSVPEGTVDIVTPLEGTIIYAESLYISGQATGVESFRLHIVTADETTLLDTTVTPDENGQWTVETPHEYSGDPTEITLYALPTGEDTIADYDISTALISPLEFRPEGVYGSIFFPSVDSVVGGDMIEVTGVASGAFENTIQVSLENNDGIISQQTLTLNNPYFIDEVPWNTELATNGTTGPATVRLWVTDAETGEDITLDSVDIMLSVAAG